MRLTSLCVGAGSVLLVAGIALVIAARPVGNAEPEPRHPITDDMRRDAAGRDAYSAPTIDRVDTEGDRLSLAKLTANGPAFLIFIMDDCPCSIEAQPYFQRLYDAFGGKVAFVGITDGSVTQGKEWKAHFQMTYPLISDPKKDLMRAFGAKHSAYSALVGKGGRVIKLWPGYNQPMLREIDQAIAAAAGIPTPKLDVTGAPMKPTSGCFF